MISTVSLLLVAPVAVPVQLKVLCCRLLPAPVHSEQNLHLVLRPAIHSCSRPLAASPVHLPASVTPRVHLSSVLSSLGQHLKDTVNVVPHVSFPVIITIDTCAVEDLASLTARLYPVAFYLRSVSGHTAILQLGILTLRLRQDLQFMASFDSLLGRSRGRRSMPI